MIYLSIDVPEKNKDNNKNNNNDILNEDKYAFLKSNSNANANKNALDNHYEIANKQLNNGINDDINKQLNNGINDDINKQLNNPIDDDISKQLNNEVNGDIYSQFNNKSSLINENENNPQNENNSFVIAGNGKIVSFVGASKNGTSFIVNCLALLLANDGIKVAIVDFTKNKNSYYLFQKTRIHIIYSQIMIVTKLKLQRIA